MGTRAVGERIREAGRQRDRDRDREEGVSDTNT